MIDTFLFRIFSNIIIGDELKQFFLIIIEEYNEVTVRKNLLGSEMNEKYIVD